MAGRKGAPNWDRIKADYLKGGTSYAKLAEKYHVSKRTLEDRARRESWADELRQVRGEVVAEIHEQAVASRVMSAQEVLEELSNIGRGGMRRIGSWGAGGLTLTESSELSDEDLSLVSEIQETRTETGGSIKVKLYDKLSALKELAKIHGLTGQQEGGAKQDVSSSDPKPLSDLEELRRLDPGELDRRISEALRPPGGGGG